MHHVEGARKRHRLGLDNQASECYSRAAGAMKCPTLALLISSEISKRKFLIFVDLCDISLPITVVKLRIV